MAAKERDYNERDYNAEDPKALFLEYQEVEHGC